MYCGHWNSDHWSNHHVPWQSIHLKMSASCAQYCTCGAMLMLLTVTLQGGETLALRRMEEHIADKEWVVQFEKPKGNPAALEPATTVLSPYLKFGCLSVRVFYQRLQQVGFLVDSHVIHSASVGYAWHILKCHAYRINTRIQLRSAPSEQNQPNQARISPVMLRLALASQEVLFMRPYWCSQTAFVNTMVEEYFGVCAD